MNTPTDAQFLTYPARRKRSSAVLADLRQALGLFHVIVYMAVGDLRSRYRRSVLGPLWITLGTAAGTVGLGRRPHHVATAQRLHHGSHDNVLAPVRTAA
jgi:hypothetical protein